MTPPPWEVSYETTADRVIEFIGRLRITSGIAAGSNFVLRPWQQDIIRALYRTNDAGRRTVRQGLITMARKNGKSQLSAALALAAMLPEVAGEARGQIVSCAADRDQAALIYNEMRAFILADEDLSDRLIIREFKKEIEDSWSGSTYRALSSDARKAHGLSPSFAICDEVAQWHDRELYDNILTGTGARAEPLVVVISTQSADPDSLMSELVRYGESVRDGVIEDPAFSPHIFAVPADADPWDEAVWPLANPALSDFLSIDQMRTAAAQARRIPARESVFRNLHLNQAIDPDDRFIAREDWDALGAPFDLDELKGRPCFAGLDLGSAADLCGLALWFPEDDRLLVWGFLPAAQLDAKERADRAPYRQWIDDGVMIATPGRAINKAWVAGKLREIAEDYDLIGVAFDRWGFKDLEVILDAEGIVLPLRPHGQGFKDMGPSVDQFERLVLEARLHHGGNPLLRWCLSSAAIDIDPAGARKVTKSRSRGRVDPLIATIMAVGMAAREPARVELDFSDLVLLA
jgi:phage terminase large subunit-like protein